MPTMRGLLALAAVLQQLMAAAAFLPSAPGLRVAAGPGGLCAAGARIRTGAGLPARARRTASRGRGAGNGASGLRAAEWGGDLAAEARTCAAVLQVCSAPPLRARRPRRAVGMPITASKKDGDLTRPACCRADGLPGVPQSGVQDENGRRVSGQGDVRRRHAGGHERDQSWRQVRGVSCMVLPGNHPRACADGWAFPCAALL